MEALVFEGPGRIAHVGDHPDPVPEGPGDAIVEVAMAGLCGSDLHPYLGAEPARTGVVPGHEAVAAEGVVDVAIEAAGPAAAQRLAARLVRPGGVVSIIIAVQTAPAFGIDPVTAYDRNLTITAGRAPVRSLLDELLPMVADGRLVPPVGEVLTHVGLPLAAGPATYRRFADREDGLVKAAFDPAPPPAAPRPPPPAPPYPSPPPPRAG